MNSAICTLFEKDYHYGLGALANSLYAHDYRGTIYAGYRGALPPWAAGAKECDGFTEFSPAEGLTLRFIPLATQIHFTNYKPDFMLETWRRHCPQAESLFYFDPDITIKCRWTFFEEWAQGGVALCEDVNSPMPSTHPLRNAWRDYYAKLGRPLPNKLDIYVNGGFVGVSVARRKFLEDWQQITQEMSPAAGSLLDWDHKDRSAIFNCADQDALNVTLMHTSLPFSLSGKEGMDIGRFGFLMSHALGYRKPWRRSYSWERLVKGFPPGPADRNFWAYASLPIKTTGGFHKLFRMADLKTAAVLERIL